MKSSFVRFLSMVQLFRIRILLTMFSTQDFLLGVRHTSHDYTLIADLLDLNSFVGHREILEHKFLYGLFCGKIASPYLLSLLFLKDTSIIPRSILHLNSYHQLSRYLSDKLMRRLILNANTNSHFIFP